MTTPQARKDEAEIRELISRWSRAVEAKDAKAIVKAYTPETVLYDAIPPYRSVGAKAVAKLWEDCFPYFPEKFRSEHKDLEVVVDGDLAFVHGLHHFVPEPADDPVGSTWMRVTACYRRIDGKWRIVHEHVSVPFDPMSGKAMTLGPNGEAKPMASCVPAEEASAARVHNVTPHLVCKDAVAALDFYKRAFGATEAMRLDSLHGGLIHACLTINGSSVMLAEEFCEMGNQAPSTLKGTPVTIHLNVADADATFDRAVAAGAKSVMPLADMFWGDRYGLIEDPFGHRWSIGQHVRAMSLDEIKEAAAKAMPMAAE